MPVTRHRHRRADAAGRDRQAAGKRRIKFVPTGLEHGTVTAILSGKPFEVTSLRRDVDDRWPPCRGRLHRRLGGRPPRRDFTINALYAARRWRDFRLSWRHRGSDRRPGALCRRCRARASARIICASCGCSASMPGTAKAIWMPTPCAPRPRPKTAWSNCPASASPRNCCGCWNVPIPCPRCG